LLITNTKKQQKNPRPPLRGAEFANHFNVNYYNVRAGEYEHKAVIVRVLMNRQSRRLIKTITNNL